MKVFTSTYRNILFCFFCISFVFLAQQSASQDGSSFSEKSLKEQEIKDLSDLAKYDKTVKKLKTKEREKKKIEPQDKKIKDDVEEEVISPRSNWSFGIGPIFSGLLYVLIAALVIFILFMIFSSIKVDKTIKNVAIAKQEEIEDIEVIDAESGLELALQAGNFREAVRMLFIKLLQVLVLEKSIGWKPEKTNRDYLREMKSHPKIQHFNNLVIAYERIWYGSEPIDKLFFEYLRADFDKFYSTENIRIDVKE